MSLSTVALLTPGEPPSWRIEHADGASPYLLLCDHAANRIPRRLGTLGLSDNELASHVAWDIGAAAVATGLGDALDATVILQTYSRLVIDCNRPPQSEESVVKLSERTPVPGNLALTPAELAARQHEIFNPYHARIAGQLDARLQRGQPTLLIAMHSFTPVYLGAARPWHAGVLYNRDPRMARRVADVLRSEDGLMIGDNQPYSVSDETDYAIPRYGESRGLPHVELEIRQDLIADAAGQKRWIGRLARMLRQVEAELVPI
ncbi:MAG: N-formylglutamate amidohydrolase [Panacagrimonas sp.]